MALVGSTLIELYAMLRLSNSLIVHFSGQPRGTGAQEFFPADLEHALSNSNSDRLACSTVKPGDKFGSGASKNATGSVGLVIAPRTTASVLDVWPTDGGSQRRRISRDVTLEECQNSISNRICYNEWAITNYDVIGMFAIAPLQVDGLSNMPDGLGNETPTVVPLDVDLDKLPSSLAALPIYTFSDQCISKIAALTTHDQIYR